MRPQADVHLIRPRQLADDRRRALQHRPQLVRLIIFEVRHVDDVSSRLDDQRPHSERPDAMLDHPATGGLDDAARQVNATFIEVAREAPLHGRYGAGFSSVSICARCSLPL